VLSVFLPYCLIFFYYHLNICINQDWTADLNLPTADHPTGTLSLCQHAADELLVKKNLYKFITVSYKLLTDWWPLQGKMICTASLQRVTKIQMAVVFCWKSLNFFHQVTCSTGHDVYSWIFLDAEWVCLYHTQLRSGDCLVCADGSHHCMVYGSKTLAIHYFGQFGACFCVSNFYPLIQGIF